MAGHDRLLLALESLACRGWQRDWSGRRLLVTAGPTREPIDPARCLTNRSTGRMGVLLAQAARLRGAEVCLLHGPLRIPGGWLEGLDTHPIETAADLELALQRRQDWADAIAMAAAVADHRRASPLPGKPAKEVLDEALREGWQRVPDLLAGLMRRRPDGQAILGFAAQSGEVLPQARRKFLRKGCDLLFANPIDRAGAGFGEEANEGWLLGPGDRERTIPRAGKLFVAHQLLTALRGCLGPPRRCREVASHTGC
jgi:phosphopantothenoylcysteine decarboxylase/phosphopantothenate--cysteine ligase